ncbi:MAG: signal peptidase I [Clostridia bacterium]|nr:MAG: signal peptidase I [Clostridia bacterium]
MDRTARYGPRRYDGAVILVALALAYLLVNIAIPSLPLDIVTGYIARPAVWGSLAFLILQMPQYKPAAKSRMRLLFTEAGVILAVFQVILTVIAGLADGFGKSPYSFTPSGILMNVVYVGATLAGMELSRAWLVNRMDGRRPALAIAWVTLLYAILPMPLAKLTALGGGAETVKFAASSLLPLLAESLLATFLAFLAGPRPALAYRGTLQAFQWLSPVLPNLQWGTQALLGTLVPAVGLLMVQKLYQSETHQFRRADTEESPAGWIMVSAVGVLFIWFSLGLLNYYPTVVLTGSMRPGIQPGDVVIVVKTTMSKVKKGDVIQVQHTGLPVMHRVVEVGGEGESRYFRTKGDANNAVDAEPVFAQNLRGKVIYVVPKIGLLSMALKGLFARDNQTGSLAPAAAAAAR